MTRGLMLLTGLAVALAITLYAGFEAVEWSAGKVTRDRHLTVNGPLRELHVNVSSGDVTIRPASGRSVEIDSRASGSLRVPKVEAANDGGNVRLRGNCPWPGMRCHVSFAVRVPRGIPVFVGTDSGDIRASGLTAGLHAGADSGDIHVDSISGPFTAAADSGDIHATGLRSTGVRASADSGDVSLAFAVSPRTLKLAADSGDITVAVPRSNVFYRTDVTVDSGDRDIALRTDPNASRSITATADSGDVELRYAR